MNHLIFLRFLDFFGIVRYILVSLRNFTHINTERRILWSFKFRIRYPPSKRTASRARTARPRNPCRSQGAGGKDRRRCEERGGQAACGRAGGDRRVQGQRSAQRRAGEARRGACLPAGDRRGADETPGRRIPIRRSTTRRSRLSSPPRCRARTPPPTPQRSPPSRTRSKASSPASSRRGWSSGSPKRSARASACAPRTARATSTAPTRSWRNSSFPSSASCAFKEGRFWLPIII